MLQLRIGWRSAMAAISSACLAVSAAAGAEELVVFSSGAPAPAQQRIVAQPADASANRIAFTIAPPGAILRRIAEGARPDVVVAPSQALDAIERQGKLVLAGRRPVARVGVGIAIRRDAQRPDIATVAALRATLLAAPSIVYPNPAADGSVAGRAIARMLAEMGIAGDLAPRTTLRQAIAGGVAMVARGEAALGLFNISEILSIDGVTMAGPLPKEVQSYITFEAAIAAQGSTVPAARAYIGRLTAPDSAKHWEVAGLEPVVGKP